MSLGGFHVEQQLLAKEKGRLDEKSAFFPIKIKKA